MRGDPHLNIEREMGTLQEQQHLRSTNWRKSWLTTVRRFIPNREGQDYQASFSLLHDDASPATPSKAKRRTPHSELHFQRSEYRNPMFRLTERQANKAQPRKQTEHFPEF